MLKFRDILRDVDELMFLMINVLLSTYISTLIKINTETKLTY